MDSILILTTGGTIDKQYFDALSQYQITDSMVTKLLSVARVTHPCVVQELLRKDSIDMTDLDRLQIAEHVARAGQSRIVVTHGTDTMTLTARALASISDKTIVLTGALAPARFSESDAAFNLGMAFATAQLAPAGLYITINGSVFPATEVEKDRQRGCFVPITGGLVVARSAEPPLEPVARIDETGTVHAPAFDVPLSSYMSDQAKQAFIRAATQRSPADGWQSPSVAKIRALGDSEFQKYVDRAKALYPVSIAERKFGGVSARVITPKEGVTLANRDRVLINVHGGGFFMGAGGEALVESIPLAGLGKFKVITVDYREGPEYKFPAASEDTASVYRELLKEYKSHSIGLYGCSAGGILSAMAVAWFQKEKLPLPGAVGVFSAGAFGAWYGDPASPGSWGGDSPYTTAPFTGQKPFPTDHKRAPLLPEYISAYLSDINLFDPLVSPALSPDTLSNFPPTLLITGTRAYDMSAAVQTHRALTKAGVDADLHLWDGMGHCFFWDVDLPESQDAFAVMTKFFGARLGSLIGR